MKFRDLIDNEWDIKAIRKNIKEEIGEREEGYEESDFENDPELLKKFRELEAFEMMQLIAASNTMTAEEIGELCSKKIRSMYEDLKITEENIVNDEIQINESRWLESIRAAQEEATVNEQAGRILGKLFNYPVNNSPGDFCLPKNEFEAIVSKELKNRVIEQIQKSNPNIKLTPKGLEYNYSHLQVAAKAR